MDIKKQLISEIEKIEDVLILEQLTALVKNSNELTEVQFTTTCKQIEKKLKETKKDIEISLKQIEDGEFVSHEEVMKTIKNA